ncbi:MFS transporter [Glutamicibacter arilaitensis]|uniref:MFS transporter n=1 Tax=Glutamicibacter arilaitensis TaxID=256701 RepID=UPI003850613D
MSQGNPRLVPALIFAALSTAIVSSLGMLLVPSIAETYEISVSSAQWMLTVNLLAGAIATPVMGRLSDGPHKKTLLLVSLIIILFGSVLAALAPNFATFLIGRSMQGLTYGIVPVTIALARRYANPATVHHSISTLSVTVATGIGIGYPLTGVVAGLWSFKWAFWFAAVFVFIVIFVVLRIIPNGPDENAPRTNFDFLGALLLAAGLGLLLLGISEGSHWGWVSIPTATVLLAALILLTIWVKVELRVAHPLINLNTLRQGEVLLANFAAIGLGAALYIGMSVASLVAQAPATTDFGLALPVFWAGFVIMPLSVGSLVANRLVRRFGHHLGYAALLPIGAVLFAAAATFLWLAHSALWELLLGMLVFGLGMGASYAAMPALIARSVAAEQLGSSVSFNQVLRTVGSSFGTAVSAAIIAMHASAGGATTGEGVNLTFAVSAFGCILLSLCLVIHFFYKARKHRA